MLFSILFAYWYLIYHSNKNSGVFITDVREHYSFTSCLPNFANNHLNLVILLIPCNAKKVRLYHYENYERRLEKVNLNKFCLGKHTNKIPFLGKFLQSAGIQFYQFLKYFIVNFFIHFCFAWKQKKNLPNLGILLKNIEKWLTEERCILSHSGPK